MILTFLFSVLLTFSKVTAPPHDIGITISSNFRGGNITVDSIAGNHIYLRPDLRDTSTDWFYWYFAVKTTQSETLHFHLAKTSYLTTGGPAVSTDGGISWKWLGKDFTDSTFSYSAEAGKEVRFSMGMPYTQANFDAFMKPFKNHEAVKIENLCTTPKGRVTEKLIIGPRDSKAAKQKVLITARHHSCEMMANYVLEGFIDALLSTDRQMTALRNRVEFWIIPFVDKDGVRDGDQGKNRTPKDHNRDYNDQSIYCSTAALRATVPGWSNGKLTAAIDLHCPWIKGNLNEHIYLVGNADKEIARQQELFMQLLSENNLGEVKFDLEKGIVPFGTAWNTSRNYTQGKSFAAWASELEGIKLASSLEIPYAVNNGEPLTPENLRIFGRDLAFATAAYLNH